MAMTSERPPDDYTSELIAAITRVTKSLDLHGFAPDKDGIDAIVFSRNATTIKDGLDLAVLRGGSGRVVGSARVGYRDRFVLT
jgi:hypothetical protein